MKLLALDGNSLAYRAYYAIPEEAMTTKDGQPTNAVYGFTNMLLRMLRERQPDYVVVCWDKRTPQFRKDIDPQYKAQRSEAPPGLTSQLAILREVLAALQVPMLEADGAEADDLLATLARSAREAGIRTEVVTGDRDAFQLVRDPEVLVIYTRRGISEVDEMDEAAVAARYGVPPSQYPELAALRGDNSDNLPGVPGVGDKTAAKLLAAYGSLDGVIENVEKLTPKQRENVAAHWAQVERNIALMRLLDELPLGAQVAELRIGPWDVEQIRSVYRTLEFTDILNRTLELADRYAPGGAAAVEGIDLGGVPELRVSRARTEEELIAALDSLEDGIGVLHEPSCWAIADASGHAVIAGRQVVGAASRAALDRKRFCGHATKEYLAGDVASTLPADAVDIDVEVAAFMLDPARGSYPLADIAARYLGVELESPDRPGQGELALGGGPVEDERAATRAWAVAALAPEVRERLERQHMWELYTDVERPITGLLARMEATGIRVDVSYLEELSGDLAKRLHALEGRIHEYAGHPFQVNSTKQLREVLFDELGLKPQKKTKTGYSTDAATLEALASEHPIVDALLEYRNLEKLRSTYTDALPPLVDPRDGRIHTSFKQTGAATGRLSSENPNLMNIPIRTEEGRRIRRAFVPRDGWLLCSADYSQVELRVMAHLSGDEHLVAAFRAGLDVHAATSSRVFGVPLDAVTADHRRMAKVVNYGLLYGMQTWGLASRLGIPREDAEAFIEAYFAQFPTLKGFMDSVVAAAKADGYTTTLLGRRRWFPELASRNPRFRQMGERQALNAPIQGSAADIMKLAMLRLDERLDAERLEARVLLQVHDELVLEVPGDERDAVAAAVKETMENAYELVVPLVADVHFGASWAECKG